LKHGFRPTAAGTREKEEGMAGRERIALLVAVLLLVLASVAAFPRAGETAGNLKTVTGIVEEVSGNSITVQGKSYKLERVPVVHPSGRRVEVSDSVRGKKVDLFLQDGQVASVVVYDPMVE
jgi:hypothetical protein